jgi:magnesium chelatase family protein
MPGRLRRSGRGAGGGGDGIDCGGRATGCFGEGVEGACVGGFAQFGFFAGGYESDHQPHTSEQKKNGPLFDLAIAIGVLKSGNFLKDEVPKNAGFIGALSLDGTVLAVEGMIAAILAAKKLKLRTLFLQYDPSIPSIDILGLELVYIETIRDVLDVLSGQQLLPFVRTEEKREERPTIDRDFNQIIGHEFAKRAVSISS